MKYLAYYDIVENKAENRNITLAATNKMKYICECIDKLGIKCEIISACATKNKKSVKHKVIRISDNITLDLPFSFGRTGKIVRGLNIILIRTGVFFKLMRMKKNETLVVYHSLNYMRIVAILKKIKKFRLILEIEEIYGDVIGKSKVSQNELKYFNIADAYIFPTELLNEKVNKSGKPHVFIYGTYSVEEDRKCKFDDGKIHAVYAGTFDPRKGGGLAAAAAAELDSNYHIHIIGFGSEKDKKSLQDTISELAKTTECEITYDGLLSGEEYIRFIQSCHIGLSTQNPDADFNDTSFPSKVLSYMANGLRVVSIRIKALERSAISDLLYYYDTNSPKAIAEAIRNVDINDMYDSRKFIAELDQSFSMSLKNLLEAGR